MKNRYRWALAGVAFSLASVAHATNGYFLHGYGVKSEALGGAGVAFPQDALAPATNPAGAAFVGHRFDLGVDYFRPVRNAEVVGSAAPSNDLSYDGNDVKNFFIPQIGYSRPLNDRVTLGLAVYGNGGLNTAYTRNVTLFGTSKAGVDLSQAFVAPTVAYKIGEKQSVGLSLNFVYQRFKATGLENFAGAPGLSAHPGDLTNRGYDTSTGWGARLGWSAEVHPLVTVGATYQTKTKTSKFKKYRGLFAEEGGFDVPANYAVGVAVRPRPAWTIAADVEKIEYSGVKSVGQTLLPGLATAQLGGGDGAGFGWRDIVVEKIGVAYELNESWTLRAGFNHGNQPVRPSETLFNILAPGVIENHATLGGTWKPSPATEVSWAYAHAFEKKVDGSGSIPASFGGGESNVKMHQDSLSVSYGVRF